MKNRDDKRDKNRFSWIKEKMYNCLPAHKKIKNTKRNDEIVWTGVVEQQGVSTVEDGIPVGVGLALLFSALRDDPRNGKERKRASI